MAEKGAIGSVGRDPVTGQNPYEKGLEEIEKNERHHWCKPQAFKELKEEKAFESKRHLDPKMLWMLSNKYKKACLANIYLT